MFKNNLNPPNNSPSQMFKPDPTMNVISWIHDFPSQEPF